MSCVSFFLIKHWRDQAQPPKRYLLLVWLVLRCLLCLISTTLMPHARLKRGNRRRACRACRVVVGPLPFFHFFFQLKKKLEKEEERTHGKGNVGRGIAYHRQVSPVSSSLFPSHTTTHETNSFGFCGWWWEQGPRERRE